MGEPDGLCGIGELARRTGLSVRTIRFWSDCGLVPPVGRTPTGHRRYDAVGVARLELVATLRQLGLGLPAIRSVLEQQSSIADVATAHARAIAAEIEALRVQQAVLVAVAARTPTSEETKLMHDLARLSAGERQRLVDDFIAETFGEAPEPTGLGERMRQLTPALPDRPTSAQLQAWIDVAELLQDPAFRARVQEMADAGRTSEQPFDREAGKSFVASVIAHAGPAVAAGVDPRSAEAEQVLRRILPEAGPAKMAQVAQLLATFSDSRVDRYWRLVGVINDWPPQPSPLPAFEWLSAALASAPAAG
jgi:DNA-binding transcriptional MerR regulator